MKINFNSKKTAFTLAEVLITLGIIGVVAVMTISLLINNIQDMQYKTAYKKAYSEASQVIKKLIADGNLDIICTNLAGGCDGSTNSYNFNLFKNEFVVTKDCSSNNNSQCWESTGELYQGFWPSSSQKAFIDNSGKAWTMISGLHIIAVDTNGFKQPNLWGRDRFPFAWANANVGFGVVQNLSMPITFIVPSDTVGTAIYCPSGNCYNKSWLYQ